MERIQDLEVWCLGEGDAEVELLGSEGVRVVRLVGARGAGEARQLDTHEDKIARIEAERTSRVRGILVVILIPSALGVLTNDDVGDERRIRRRQGEDGGLESGTERRRDFNSRDDGSLIRDGSRCRHVAEEVVRRIGDGELTDTGHTIVGSRVGADDRRRRLRRERTLQARQQTRRQARVRLDDSAEPRRASTCRNGALQRTTGIRRLPDLEHTVRDVRVESGGSQLHSADDVARPRVGGVIQDLNIRTSSGGHTQVNGDGGHFVICREKIIFGLF